MRLALSFSDVRIRRLKGLVGYGLEGDSMGMDLVLSFVVLVVVSAELGLVLRTCRPGNQDLVPDG
jgi:hypothetical protein